MFTSLARHARPPGSRPASRRQRRVTLLLAALVTAMATLFWPAAPAVAAPSGCTLKQWANPTEVQNCIKQLPAASQTTSECMGVPIPSAPDSGFGGWFASDPKLPPGVRGFYSSYGYSGYTYPVYNPGCASGMSPLPSSEGSSTTIANSELMIATGIVGAANAFRERAYNPDKMWGWADKLVSTATKAVYEKVFSVFGVISIAVVGIYLIWRSRQANMSDAMTTAGWAILVMAVVTAVAAWPLVSAHLADNTLVASLGVVHDAVGPQPKNVPPKQCPSASRTNRPPGVPYDPDLCKDKRPPALRASDTATQAVLYDNWLRGTLGSATSPVAKKYGLALYQSSALSWDEAKSIARHPDKRATLIKQKSDDFQRVAAQIKKEDPSAYEYLQGKNGSARIGAGLIAILSAVAFSFFDIAASLLIILGFLIFRWAVVAIPIIGTIAILRPASGGFKRLVNIVVAAIFNIIIFGAGASIYLFAVDIIMNTTTLAGWLQVLLVWLCGVVGWLLLRPYRRITQLGGKNPMGELAGIGSWHRRFFGDLKGVAIGAAGAAALGDIESQDNKDDRQGRTKSAGPDRTGDRQAPATAGGEAPADAPAPGHTADQPAGSSTPDPAGAPPTQPQPAGSGSQRGGYQETDDTVDDRVWVPATGRYAGRGDYGSLADDVDDANSRIAAHGGDLDGEADNLHRSERART